MILSDHLRNRPAGVPPPARFPLLLNGDFIKREITLLTNRHRYLSKPAQHFISLTQAFFAAIELERIWLPDTKLNIWPKLMATSANPRCRLALLLFCAYDSKSIYQLNLLYIVGKCRYRSNSQDTNRQQSAYHSFEFHKITSIKLIRCLTS